MMFRGLRFIPTPSISSVGLGHLRIHFYAICILLGTIIAISIGRKRYRNVGAEPAEIYDLAIYVIPAGIVGGRLYHVITSPELYFGAHGHLIDVIKIWNGGMGIWGAVGLGTITAFVVQRRIFPDSSFAFIADALAPGILIAQAVGRLGNWFNGELFGKPSTLPWAVSIPFSNRPVGYQSFATFTPTFAYEALWCVATALIIFYLPSVRRLAPGNTFLLYLVLYCLGRAWIETLRIDSAHEIGGVRINVWVASICLVASLIALIFRQRRWKVAGLSRQKL